MFLFFALLITSYLHLVSSIDSHWHDSYTATHVRNKNDNIQGRSPNVVKVIFHTIRWERSGSVVECLTRDQRTAGSSLTGFTALCP